MNSCAKYLATVREDALHWSIRCKHKLPCNLNCTTVLFIIEAQYFQMHGLITPQSVGSFGI